MTTPKTTKHTGLPPGVQVGGAAPRLLAYVIDHALPVVVGAVAGGIAAGSALNGRGRTVVLIATILISLAWGIFVWRMYAVKAAGPGMRVAKLQLVGYRDGRPIGWGRFLLRWLVLALLSATGIGLLIMIIAMVVHPRQQGWHDLAAESVVIRQRSLPPSQVAVTRVGGDRPAGHSPDSPTTDPAGTSPTPSPTPTPTPTPTPAAAQETAVRTAEIDPDRPAAEWVLMFDEDWDLAIDGLVLLGRNPQPQPGEEDAQLIKIADTTRTVSKTHLAVGVDSNGLYVMDRGSTNGSTVTTPDGFSLRCTPGDVTPVDKDNIVSFGDHWFRVTRG